MKWDAAIRCSHFLNHRTRGNDGVFGDDDDAVADGVGVVFCFADVFCVLDGDVFTNARVFVDDCAVDYASRTDADVWDAFLFVAFSVFGGFVKVSPHHDGVGEFDAGTNDAAYADDRMFDFCVLYVGAVADFALFEVAAIQFGRGEVARVGVDGGTGLIKGEGGRRSCEREVGFVEGADGADVFPVALESVGIDVVGVNGGGDDVFAKVVAAVFREERSQSVFFKDVDAHGGHVRFVGVAAGCRGEFEVVQFGVGLRFFYEVGDAPGVIYFEEAEFGRDFSRDGFDCDGEVCAFFAVFGDEVPVVHAVEVVAREDEVLIYLVGHEVAELLANRVGCALIPVEAVFGLFGGEDFDKAV